ncbi:hypothetical protein CDAR_65701 [Caerostris darwini]|uniref:Uncharacterized protein n=1 Tax=Caerostris darwini TaxID=1538125 RepID=A0AAV4UBY3_9ARAC|nr:hypothetical protein CDAR_65701 [Caerostris darwini]
MLDQTTDRVFDNGKNVSRTLRFGFKPNRTCLKCIAVQRSIARPSSRSRLAWPQKSDPDSRGAPNMDVKVMGLHKSSTFSNFGNHKLGNWFSTLGHPRRKSNALKNSKSLRWNLHRSSMKGGKREVLNESDASCKDLSFHDVASSHTVMEILESYNSVR